MTRIRRYQFSQCTAYQLPHKPHLFLLHPYPTSLERCQPHAIFKVTPRAGSSSFRPARRSLAYIGIPNHHDVLAAQIRWANAWFYTHHRRRRCRRLRPILVSIERHEVSDAPSSSQTEVSVQAGALRNINVELFCVGGQFA